MRTIDIENVAYEVRPYVYGLIGVFSAINYHNKLLLLCGIILVSCSALVIKMRLDYRSNLIAMKALIEANRKKKSHGHDPFF